MKKGRYNRNFSLLLTVFLLSFTLISAQGVDDLEIVVNNESFSEDELIDLSVLVNVSEAIPETTTVNADIGEENASRTLIELLNYGNINYETSGSAYSIAQASQELFFTFNQAGEQVAYLKLGGPDNSFESLDLTITGFGSGSNYPHFPSIDFGSDGTAEWQHFGNFIGFLGAQGAPGLSAGVAQVFLSGAPASSASGTSRIYYCENMNLPYARDYEISAYMANVTGVNISADVKATIFNYDSLSSTSFNAYGGSTFDCDLPVDEGNDTFSYHSCTIHLGYAIRGEHLVCVYDAVTTSGPESENHALLQRDGSGSDAYNCIRDGEDFTCSPYNEGDYLITVSAANYSKDLVGTSNFTSGLVNPPQLLVANLNSLIGDCIPVENGCVISMTIRSEGSGILSLQNLDMRYQSGNPPATTGTSTFYSQLNGEEGDITIIGGLNLSEGGVFSLDLSGLTLFAPEVDEDTNYTLSVDFSPGASDTAIVLITPNLDLSNLSALNSSNAQQILDEYIQFFQKQESNYGSLLERLGFSSSISSFISRLNGIRSDILSVLGQGNLSSAEQELAITDITRDLEDDLDTLVRKLPRSISVLSDREEVIQISPEDISADMVSANQETLEQLYYHQNSFTVNGKAQYVEIVAFDDTILSGTLVEKSISGSGSQYTVFETIPKGLGLGSSDIGFSEDFFLSSSSSGLLYQKEYSSVSSFDYSYFVQGVDVSGSLDEMKTVLVPKRGVPDTGAAPITASCGDGVCTMLMVDGEMIPLEDALSCPEDCGKQINWNGILIVLLVGVLVIVAVMLFSKYTKPQEKKVRKSGEVNAATLFASPADEKKLKQYITSSLHSGKSKDKVQQTLLTNGWTKEQVDYAFKTLNKEKKEQVKTNPASTPNFKAKKKDNNPRVSKNGFQYK